MSTPTAHCKGEGSKKVHRSLFQPPRKKGRWWFKLGCWWSRRARIAETVVKVKHVESQAGGQENDSPIRTSGCCHWLKWEILEEENSLIGLIYSFSKHLPFLAITSKFYRMFLMDYIHIFWNNVCKYFADWFSLCLHGASGNILFAKTWEWWVA